MLGMVAGVVGDEISERGNRKLGNREVGKRGMGCWGFYISGRGGGGIMAVEVG